MSTSIQPGLAPETSLDHGWGQVRDSELDRKDCSEAQGPLLAKPWQEHCLLRHLLSWGSWVEEGSSSTCRLYWKKGLAGWKQHPGVQGGGLTFC